MRWLAILVLQFVVGASGLAKAQSMTFGAADLAGPTGAVGEGACAVARLAPDGRVSNLDEAVLLLGLPAEMTPIHRYLLTTPDETNGTSVSGGDFSVDRPMAFSPIGSPMGPGEGVVIRWWGEIRIDRARTVSFAPHSDDGMRFSIAGRVVVEDPLPRTARVDSRTVRFDAPGRYPFEIVYFENAHDALLEWSYSEASVAETRGRSLPEPRDSWRLVPTSWLTGGDRCGFAEPQVDGGPPALDGGPPALDGGPPAIDAGPPAYDAGPGIPDGAVRDGGPVRPDAGPASSSDAGRDAGVDNWTDAGGSEAWDSGRGYSRPFADAGADSDASAPAGPRVFGTGLCQAAPWAKAELLPLLCLPLMLLLIRRRRMWIALGVLLVCAPASAQSVSLERLRPPMTGGGGVLVGSPPQDDLGHVSLVTSVAFEPLSNYAGPDAVDPVSVIVASQTSAFLLADVRVFEGLHVGARVPAVLYFGSREDAPPGDFEAGLGDISLGLSLLLPTVTEALRLGLSGAVDLPTATGGQWTGDRSLGAQLFGQAELNLHPVRLSLEVGVRARNEIDLFSVAIGSEAQVGLSATCELLPSVALRAEGMLATGLRPEAALARGSTWSEVMLGLVLEPVGELQILLGATVGLSDGIGIPAARLFGSVSWSAGTPEELAPPPAMASPPSRAPPRSELTPPMTRPPSAEPSSAVGAPPTPSAPYRDVEPAVPPPPIPGAAHAAAADPPSDCSSTTIGLPAVFFDTDSDRLISVARPTLQMAALHISDRPESQVSVSGYADARGAEPHNDSLSLRRAEAVASFLVGLGVPLRRLSLRAFGEAAATGRESSAMGADRRVEIRLIPPGCRGASHATRR